MYIPKIAGNPAFMPYIFSLKQYRVLFVNSDGKTLVWNGYRFVRLSSWIGNGTFNNIDYIKDFFANDRHFPDRDRFFIECEINEQWVSLKYAELIHELTNV